DLAYLRLPAKVVDTAKKVLEVLKVTIDFLESVDGLSQIGQINFGTFNLTEQTLEDPNAAMSDDDLVGNSSNAGSNADLQKLLKGPNQKGLDKPTTKKSGRAGVKKTTGKRYQIPVLEDPLSLVNFILGRGEADLFWYDLPDLELDFDYRSTFFIFPGLNGKFLGKISAFTNFDFGFDTRGLRQWMDRDFDPGEAWRIFNGFYLDDHGKENTAGDADELGITIEVAAGASLGIGGLVEAGVLGGVTANIGFNLNDKETDFENDLPIGDGKMYGSELLDRITQGPECLFDVHGQLKVFLEAFLWIGLDLGITEITIFEARKRFVDQVIAQFDWECTLRAPQTIATLTDGNLNLQYSGSNSGGAQTYKVDVLPIDDDLTLQNLVRNGYLDTEYYDRAGELALRDQLASFRNYAELPTTPDEKKYAIVVSTGYKVQVYKVGDVDSITVNGTGYADHYDMKRLNGRVHSITINSGGGDDVINLTGETNIVDDVPDSYLGAGQLDTLTINAGAGDDIVSVDNIMLGNVNGQAYEINGQDGNDQLSLTGSNALYEATFNGGAGDDYIYGKDGIDNVFGGPGFDVIATYGAADYVEGGDEPDAILALYVDADGKQNVSPIYQLNGLPFPNYDQRGNPADAQGNPISVPANQIKYRSYHGDVIDSGAGDDVVYAGEGWDQVFSGPGTNTVYGGVGNDIIDAGTGASKIRGDEGDDTIIWKYSPLDGSPSLFGDSEDINNPLLPGPNDGDDTLSVTIDDNANAVDLRQHTPGETASVLQLVGEPELMVFDQIEKLELDVAASGDSVHIFDLIGTSLQSVDLQLGSRKATMIQPERDADGNYQVYSAGSSSHEGTPRVVFDAVHSAYRFELDEAGIYLKNPDGTPDIRTAAYPAEPDETIVNRSVQSIGLIDGLTSATLFYGYDEDNTETFGYTAADSVTINAQMTALEIKNAIQSLPSVTGDVTVDGTGTADDPWVVRLTSATRDAAGRFQLFGYQFAQEAHSGNLKLRNNAAVADYFYRYDLAEGGEYLFAEDGTPLLQSVVDPASDAT
ncbi:MAG: calcium-binding protein, partial [Planctomycetales bacterium]|nr:calcium-binding protein [Planctomycetales bacterium]